MKAHLKTLTISISSISRHPVCPKMQYHAKTAGLSNVIQNGPQQHIPHNAIADAVPEPYNAF
jgi:hypothetical protein